MDNAQISLCSRSMNRNFHLDESLPTWVAIKEIEEIIIVDWSSVIPVKAVVDKYQNGKITIIRIDGKKYWNSCIPRNVGIRAAKSKFIFTVDADIRVNRDVFKYIVPEDNVFYTGGFKDSSDKENKYSTCGTSLISRELLLSNNGFNEDMGEMFTDDSELYHRLSRLGAKWDTNNLLRYVHAIPHKNDVRMKNSKFSDFSSWHQLSVNFEKTNPIPPQMQKMDVTIIYPDNTQINTTI